MWLSSSSELPTCSPRAAMNVYAMPPPTTSVSTFVARTLSTSSLSATLAPPTTATNGRAGCSRIPPSTSTSRAKRNPAALGRNRGGPTMDAWARWAAPKASST